MEKGAPTTWRLIPYAEYDGAMNMAIDQAIMEAVADGASPPTLRVYGFKPPCVTIGLNQKMTPDAVRAIESAGFDIVRRPTGGRAVLHLDDLTYSFVGADVTAPAGFLSTSVTQSYKQICQGLIAAFGLLGVDSELGSAGAAYRHLQDCFMATTGCDLHHQGTKLIGSAQFRRRGQVLQHGSVPLCQEQTTMARLLGEPGAQQRHANLNDIAGRALSFGELQDAFKAGFERAFGVEVLAGSLSENELGAAKQNAEKFKLVTVQKL